MKTTGASKNMENKAWACQGEIMATFGSHRRQWGGFFEIAVMSQRWRYRTHILREVAQELKHFCSIGREHRKEISVVWTGSHYRALRILKQDDFLKLCGVK